MLNTSQVKYIIFINPVVGTESRECEHFVKINELAKLTGIKLETVRMYREKNFLHPKQLKNGYYDYSMADFVNMVYLRKFREYGFSLADIYRYEHATDTKEVLDILDFEQQAIQQQMNRLKERQEFLKLEQRHITESDQISSESAMVMQSVDDKYDYYGKELIQKFIAEWKSSAFYLTTTSCIRISKDILNGDVVDQEFVVQVGIGTYGYMLKRKEIPVSKGAYVVPNGKCISQMLAIKNDGKINIKQLEPMISLAKKLGKPFISDTTGYLSCIRYDKNEPIYLYRVRACIEENDIREQKNTA